MSVGTAWSPWSPPVPGEPARPGPWDDDGWPDADRAEPGDGRGADDGQPPGGLDTLVLTDEELLALEAQTPLVPLPYAAQLPPEHREAALGTALRCLAARGLVRRRGRELQVVDVLSALLRVRAGAPVLAVLRREVGAPVPTPPVDGGDGALDAGAGGPAPDEESLLGLRHLHVSGEVVVIEDVTASGLHVFALAELGGLESVVAAYLDLDGAPPGEGEVDAAPEAGAGADPVAAVQERLDSLRGPTTLVDVAVRDATGPAGEAALVTVALGPRGTFVAQTRMRADGTGEPVRFRPSSVDAVAAEIAGLVRDAVAAVEAQEAPAAV